MEGELKLLLRQFKHKATSTYSYLIASKLNNAILIDPVKEEIKKYQKKLKEFNLELKYAIDTHVHADHITALGDLRDIYDCKTIMGEQSKVNCISQSIRDGENLYLDEIKIKNSLEELAFHCEDMHVLGVYKAHEFREKK